MKHVVRPWRITLLLIAASVPALAAAPPPCAAWPEARARIEAALARAGWVAAALPQLPCGFAARVPEAEAIAVVKSWRDPARSVFEARLRCLAPANCLPFVVAVMPLAAGEARQDALANPAPNSRIATASSPMPKPNQTAPLLVKAGQKVALVWEKGNLRLIRAMVCLDSGRAGEAVRTRARDGGPVVSAQVISAGWVKVSQ